MGGGFNEECGIEQKIEFYLIRDEKDALLNNSLPFSSNVGSGNKTRRKKLPMITMTKFQRDINLLSKLRAKIPGSHAYNSNDEQGHHW